MLRFDVAHRRYQNDPAFHHLVDAIAATVIDKLHWTDTDLDDAIVIVREKMRLDTLSRREPVDPRGLNDGYD